MNIKKLWAFFGIHYPVIGVLLGSFLIATSMGTYTNWDAKLEFEAASNVLGFGFPIVTTGLMINQPPLGFYTSAPVFQIFGLTYNNGVGLATAFGLGSVALVYALGTLLYGKRTGIVASGIFSLIPWHVYMERIFLIDNQCLFLSLLFLCVGVFAFRSNSERLVIGAGVVFALALLTKLFAVFMLVPLLLIYFKSRKYGFYLSFRRVLFFLLPSIVLQTIWFGGLANQNFFGVYLSSDFTHPVLIAEPSFAFLPIIFVKSAGWFLFLAVFFSLALSISYRKQFEEYLWVDMVCLGTIASIMAIDILLVFGFHLTVPYISAVKYNYMTLPFFCLLAASLSDKGSLLLRTMKNKKKLYLTTLALLGVGLTLLFGSLLESLFFLNTWTGFVAFGVDSVVYYGFELFSQAMDSGILLVMHYAGFVLVVGAMFLPALYGIVKKTVVGTSEHSRTNPSLHATFLTKRKQRLK